MSGGSFNYLYLKEVPELMASVTDIEDMSDICIKKHYYDVAKDLTRLAEYIRSAETRISILHKQLRDVMHAIEWYESCDYGEDDLEKAIVKYRTGGET